MSEDEKNVRLSGSDPSGSLGSNSGSDERGSVGSDNGSGGSVDGSGGSDHGSGGSGGSGTGTDSGSGSADSDNSKPSDGITDGNSDAARDSRSARDRGNRTVRLGSADRDRATGTGRGSDGTGAEAEAPLADEPVIRLGAKKGGRPRAETKTADNTTELKLSEMKDIILMFLDSIFEVPAVIMRQEFWRLSKDENKMLTDAISAYIKSMPKSKSTWLMTFIQDNLPLVNLLMIGFFIVSDRVKGSIAVAQVTRAGNKFAQATAEPAPTTRTVVTPLDNMFN